MMEKFCWEQIFQLSIQILRVSKHFLLYSLLFILFCVAAIFLPYNGIFFSDEDIDIESNSICFDKMHFIFLYFLKTINLHFKLHNLSNYPSYYNCMRHLTRIQNFIIGFIEWQDPHPYHWNLQLIAIVNFWTLLMR